MNDIELMEMFDALGHLHHDIQDLDRLHLPEVFDHRAQIMRAILHDNDEFGLIIPVVPEKKFFNFDDRGVLRPDHRLSLR